MKVLKILKTFFLILFIYSNAYSQEEEENYVYKVKESIIVYSYDFLNGKPDETVKKSALPPLEFYKVGKPKVDPKLGLIQIILPIPIVPNAFFDSNPNIVNSSDNQKYFCFKIDDLQEGSIIKKYSNFTKFKSYHVAFGTMVVPVKIRPSKDNLGLKFKTDFSLGNSIGIKTRLSPYRPYYLSLQAIFGLASVEVDSASTKGEVKKSSDRPAIVYGGGLIGEFDSFQVGFVLGRDIISDELGQKWLYQNKTWWSIGIGYQFLRKD